MSTKENIAKLLAQSTPEFEAERLILDATELIVGLMERQGLSRTELAERIGKSKGHISQLLNGERNMTLRTLAEITHALGHRIGLEPAALASQVDRPRDLLPIFGAIHRTGSDSEELARFHEFWSDMESVSSLEQLTSKFHGAAVSLTTAPSGRLPERSSQTYFAALEWVLKRQAEVDEEVEAPLGVVA